MTTITLADWTNSPELVVGEREHRLVTIAAMTEVDQSAEQMDFLLYELDRAKVVEDHQLPPDVVRIGSIVRYRAFPDEERTVKLVLPDGSGEEKAYRLSVTSRHGAALLGLRAGQMMSWVGPDGVAHRIKVLKVANTPTGDAPGPSAA